ncbi:RagB/SusD family nutrient uptake outer membrane protein [Flavobacterium sp. LS1R49]|uniref:RagB/SusD family nutrient uptake outer membrane protein n=1 Tax=Flavobacterium shii TaxID=2987687 RepID=A0A9X2ZEJ7_9FLAO|nr:RagB/SusD family nutrient uptake outer membrane protein [Flavobacterium shii]MCV9929210.1 RagB/SusD family nutrient uptake outer membrane protein [Flavobacterium shii]
MKYIHIATLLIGLATFTSCDNELTIDPVGLVTDDQINATPTLNTVEKSVSSSYLMFSNTLNIMGAWNWDDGLVSNNDIILQDMASDDMQKTWVSNADQPWMDDVDNFTFTSENGGVNGVWKYNYEGIKRTNSAINFLINPEIESITGITTERKNQLLGEAYFLRSFYYFALVTNFGDVSLILAPVKTYQEAFDKAVRAPKAEVWNQISTDLALAKSLLPNSKFSSETEKWRVSKGAVIALQAKVALYNEKWSDVITSVNELEGLGFYGLNANYFDNFSVGTEYTDNEVIFSFDHQSNVVPARGNGHCALAGWNFFAPTTDFLNSFEPNDPRKLYTVNAPQQWVNKILGTINGDNKGNDQSPSNKVFIRMADALLWKAEALNETGDYSTAIDYINKIRIRARTTITADGTPVPAGTLPDRPASSDKATIKNWLISERRAELGFENQRMADLKRWGIAKQVMNASGKKFQDKNILYPIPQSEINASAGTLTQNPGY